MAQSFLPPPPLLAVRPLKKTFFYVCHKIDDVQSMRTKAILIKFMEALREDWIEKQARNPGTAQKELQI